MGYEGAPRQHLSTHVEKQLELVANLLEVLDGLMLEPSYNVSERLGMDVLMRGKGGGTGADAEARRLF